MEYIDFREHFQKLSEKGIVNTSFKGLLTEAISAGQFSKANKLIKQYLNKKLQEIVVSYGSPTVYQNTVDGKVTTIEYFVGNDKYVKFNWSGTGINSNALTSVYVFDDPNKPNSCYIKKYDKLVSLVKTLPDIVEFIQTPIVGEYVVVPDLDNIEESYLTEARTKQFSGSDLFRMVMDNMVVGTVPSVKLYELPGGQAAVKVYTTIKKMYPEYWNKKTYIGDVVGGKDMAKSRFGKESKKIFEAAGLIQTTVTQETIVQTDITPISSGLEQYQAEHGEIDSPDDMARITYEETLEAINELAGLVIARASNALFITGRGGVGKSFNLEKLLASKGYVNGQEPRDNKSIWISGSMTASQLYIQLALNPNALFLIDDCDKIFEDQEGRNLLKAATDTKKVRIISWLKGASGTYKVLPQSKIDTLDDEEKEFVVPNKFEFTGRIIFVSNLPLSKLDPDGALSTRGYMIEAYPTDEEVITFMRKLVQIPNIVDYSELEEEYTVPTLEQAIETIEMVWEFYKKGFIKTLNLRLIDRGLKCRAVKGDNYLKSLKFISGAK